MAPITCSKWFRRESAEPDDELTEAQARRVKSCSRIWFDSRGTRVRAENYTNGELFQVRYHDGALEEIRAERARDYPGVRFAVVREETAEAGFRWSFMARYDADGSLAGFTTELVNLAGEAVMMVEYGAAGDVDLITKFWDEMPDEDGMMFQYGSDGRNIGVLDLEDGDTLRFVEVLGALTEPDFYADGFALPPELSGTSIPDPRERF